MMYIKILYYTKMNFINITILKERDSILNHGIKPLILNLTIFIYLVHYKTLFSTYTDIPHKSQAWTIKAKIY